jgi:hypothetical protein
MSEMVGDPPAPEATPPSRHPWPAIGLTAVAAVASAVSLSRPLSFDEMYWLTMARRIFGAGDLPYLDLLDNKGPLLYGLFGLADLLPLAERGALTALFVGVVSALVVGVWRLAGSRGQSPPWQLFSAGLVGVSMVTLSVGAVTTELIASVFIVWAFAARTPWAGVAAILAACLVDPRAALFAPIVLFDASRRGKMGTPHIVVASSLAFVAVATVLLMPELRYAFIEASLATRFDAHPRDLLLVTVAALSPLFVLGTVRFPRVPAIVVALGAVAIAIGFSAGLPYGHYWVYVSLVIPLLPITGPRFSVPITAVVGLLAVLALVLATRDHFLHDRTEADRHEPVAGRIADRVEPDDQILVWASAPHLRYRVAAQTLGFAPTSNYFAWGLPDSDRLLTRLAEDLDNATLVVVHPGLEAYRGFPLVEQALDLVAARISESACSEPIGDTTIYRFADC